MRVNSFVAADLGIRRVWRKYLENLRKIENDEEMKVNLFMFDG